ncbi:MAG: HDIG domain-containing protein [Acidimicrobiia bacterium]|nr:HDIG domain-containing protein [Acidimicrobiia bacterium]
MSFFRRYSIPLNLLVIAVTMVFVGASLVVGRAAAAEPVEIAAGLPSPEDYIATQTVEITDQAATELAREAARQNTPRVYSINPEVALRVRNDIAAFFENLEELAYLTPQEAEVVAERSQLQQLVDEIIGGIDGAAEAGIVVFVSESEELVVLTGTIPEGGTRDVIREAIAEIDGRNIDDSALVEIALPPPTTTSSTTTTTEAEDGEEATTTTTTTTTTTQPPETTTTTTTLPRRPVEDWVEALDPDYPTLRGEQTILDFITLYNSDLDRVADGEAPLFDVIVQATDDLVEELMTAGIRQIELDETVAELLGPVPPIFIRELPIEERDIAHEAIGELVADQLETNEFLNEALTVEAEQKSADEVEDVKVPFLAGSLIAKQGEVLTPVQFEAITELDLVEKGLGTSRRAIVLLGGLAVALTAFFLWRLAPQKWSEPKHFALLGILLVLAALVSRMPELVNTAEGETNQVAFAIPAMLFGYTAAILYDPRTAVLMAVPVTTFVGVSTGDVALTMFVAVATVAPVAFVSSVSSRRQLRLAVALSAVVLVPFGAIISWFFRGWETYQEAALFALLGGIVGGLIAQGLVSFLENLFRITTTLTLLDLVDRNHPALRLIEEKAPGTFNHSILVGTLAGKAAREIGADPLLAQAAAFYHDLGKTEDPIYFIENQVSITNPHDHLNPVESCKIIRNHVTDGLRLARQYRLPPEIQAGIRCHHGTGLMRYFYHQALEADPEVDPQQFRHHGQKPKRKEMAILMICDAVEGAARAHAQQQEPTAESITKVVDSVVGEKLDDGQLDEAALTFGDLTTIKAAIVDALIGYYHTRVPYPGFPGAQVKPA